MTSGQQPAHRRIPAKLVEAGLVAGVAGASLAGVIAEYRYVHRPLPPLYGAVVLAAVAAGVLTFRHRAALMVTLSILGICLLYRLLGYPGLAVAAPMYVACYTLGGMGRNRRTLGVAAASALGVPLAALLPHPSGANTNAILGVTITLAAVLTLADAKRAWRIAAEEQLRRITRAARDEADRRAVEERLAIARELHDVLAHTITVISVQAAAGLDATNTRPEQVGPALTIIRSAAKEAMTELRSTLRVLRENPATGPAAPQPRLENVPQLAQLARDAGLHVDLVTVGDPVETSPGVELAAYRIVQEALTNVIRHAQAGTATIRLEYLPDTLLVEVTDNGRGGTGGSTDGHGMIGMRERVHAVGGTFEAAPVPPPGPGFTVRARLPLRGAP